MFDPNDVPSDPSRGGFDYNAAFANATTEEAETKVSGITIESFGYYIVHFGGAKAAFKSTGVPSVRPWSQVREGPTGTVGHFLSDDLGNPFIAPSPTTEVDGVKVKKDAATYAKQGDVIQKLLNKVARVGEFQSSHPTDLNSLAALEAYAKQFEGRNGEGFDAIIEVSTEKNEYQGNTTFRNRIKWDSMRAFTDPAVGKEFAGKTALEEARAKIAERNKRNAGAKTGTAGATSRPSPESMFTS